MVALYKWQVKGALRSGMVLTVKSVEELKKEFGELSLVPGKFTNGMSIYCGTKFRVTPEIKDVIWQTANESEYILFKKDGYIFTAAMLKPNKKELCEHVETVKITESVEEDEVVKEMLSKVDFELMKHFFALGTWGTSGYGDIRDNLVEEYLTDWARNKKWLYLLMGRNLSIKKTIKVNKTEGEMSALIEELSQEFPVYSFHLKQFETEDVLNNIISFVPGFYTRYTDICRKGMKLSRFLSQLLNDNAFDIALSKIMQNTKIDATVEISINPMDYMTMSIHKHKWSSCYDISQGCYSNCAFAIMRDSGSVIAFKHNDKEYDYNFSLEDKEFSYKWNSKQMRSVLYIDEATKCIFSCLAQGSADDIYYNAIDSLAEELFVGKEYVKIKKYNNWTPNKEFTTSVKHGKYDHISDDCKYVLKPTDSHLPERIVFGVDEIKNPATGKIVTTHTKLK